jgi:hypothetical protein
MSEIKIQKIKILKDGAGLRVFYETTGGDCPGDDNKMGKNICHPDLMKAVKGLSVHLAVLTEYIDEKDCHKNDEVDKFVVTGFKMVGKEDEEGVVLEGYRKTRYKKKVPLPNTPPVRFKKNQKNPYVLQEDLQKALKLVEDEVALYLGGKKGTDAQGELYSDKQVDEAIEKATGKKVTRLTIAHPVDGGIPAADPDAMERVAGWVPPQQTVTGGRRRGAQSAANPAGI